VAPLEPRFSPFFQKIYELVNVQQLIGRLLSIEVSEALPASSKPNDMVSLEQVRDSIYRTLTFTLSLFLFLLIVWLATDVPRRVCYEYGIEQPAYASGIIRR